LDVSPQDLDGTLSAIGVRADEKVLVNNMPVYFYQSRRPGIYYWCGSDQLFLADGPTQWLRNRTQDEALRYMVDSLHCRVIFSSIELSDYDPLFRRFLDDRCELVHQDDKGHTLHRIRDQERL
jgi:hypothetical protein